MMNHFIQEQSILYITKLKSEREAAAIEWTVNKKTPIDAIKRSAHRQQMAKPNPFTRIARQMVQMVIPMRSNTKLGRRNRAKSSL